jgi:CheY-like chemotaxis protein
MDGVNLVRALKGVPVLADVPVVMMSAVASPPALSVPRIFTETVLCG